MAKLILIVPCYFACRSIIGRRGTTSSLNPLMKEKDTVRPASGNMEARRALGEQLRKFSKQAANVFVYRREARKKPTADMSKPSNAIPVPPDPPPCPPMVVVSPSPVLLRTSTQGLLNAKKHRLGVLKVLKEMARMQKDLLSDLQVLVGCYLAALDEKLTAKSTPNGAGTNTLTLHGDRHKGTAPPRVGNASPTQHDIIIALRKLAELLININLPILRQLETRFKDIKAGDRACIVSDIVLAVADTFKQYHTYPEASAAITHVLEEQKGNKEINELLFSISQRAECRNQPIRYFLKRPLEFLDKYCLLGKVLVIYTHHKEPDYPALLSALEKMDFELKRVKKQMQRQTNKTRMVILGSLLQGMFDKNLLTGNRELIYNVSCWRMTDRKKNYKSTTWQKKSLELFLFSDIILLAKKKSQMLGSESYKFYAKLSLGRSIFNVIENSEHKGTFELREISLNDEKEDTFYMLSTDSNEKRDFLQKQFNKTQFKLFSGQHHHSLSETRKEKLKKVKGELAQVKGKLAKEKHKNQLLKAKVFKFKKMKLALQLHHPTQQPQQQPELHHAHHGRSATISVPSLEIPHGISFPPLLPHHINAQELKEGEEVKHFQPKKMSLPTLAPPKRPSHKRCRSVGQCEEAEHAASHNTLLEKYGLDQASTSKSEEVIVLHPPSPSPTTIHIRTPPDRAKEPHRPPAIVVSEKKASPASSPQPPQRALHPQPQPERERKGSQPEKPKETKQEPPTSTVTGNKTPRDTPTKPSSSSSPSSSSGEEKHEKKKPKKAKKPKEATPTPSKDTKKDKRKKTPQPAEASPSKKDLSPHNSPKNDTLRPVTVGKAGAPKEATTKQPRELMQRIGNMQKEKQSAEAARSEVKYWLV